MQRFNQLQDLMNTIDEEGIEEVTDTAATHIDASNGLNMQS